MDTVNIISSHLFIPKQYIQPIWSAKKNRIIVLVHKSWLSLLLNNNAIPNFIFNENLSKDEVEAALLQGHDFAPPWQRVLVQVLKKPALGSKALSLPRPRGSQPNEDAGLSYPQLLHYISQTNYKNLWKQQYKKYLGDKKRKSRENKKNLSCRDASSVVRDIICRLYGCPIIHVGHQEKSTAANSNFQPHANVLPALCAIETNELFFLLHPIKCETTLKHFVMFSPTVFEDALNKAMFVSYQLVHSLRDSHDRALILGDVRFDDIYISNDLFIQIVPELLSNLFLVSDDELSVGHEDKAAVHRSPVDNSLASLSQRWIIGDLSNFDYLMRLNEAAGRRYGNPCCHFIMPWVSDLSTRSNGIWRDLTKSKFRLNKGDRQLDLTYEQTSSLQPPHHVTDVLSEITYYVYLARRTSREVLCKYVRPNWVPAEYPASIQRLYSWTPDECIPQFYTDPSIFKSLHEDLGDLELPPWAPTPEQFINAHKEQLESRRVSEKLHHWIDLTFGYKLSGAAAVKSKNVCLHLASTHNNLSTSGVVQVFSQPHPRRQGLLSGFDKLPPKQRKMKTHTEDDGQHSSDADDDDSKVSPLLLHRYLSLSRTSLLAPFQSSSDEALAFKSSAGSSSSATGSGTTGKINSGPVSAGGIVDNPLALLNSVENTFAFHLRTFGTPPASGLIQCEKTKLKQAVATMRLKEMQILGCLISELFVYSNIQIQKTNNVDERISVCLNQLTNENIPHCVRPALRLLLDSYPPITDVGLPPPSAHQILQPLLSAFILPFSQQLPDFYSTVTKIKLIERYNAAADIRFTLFTDSLEKVINCETIDLVYPFVKDLLMNPVTAESVIPTLLDKVFSFLEVNKVNEIFLDTILSLYERAPPLLQLYQRRLLLTLMIRCGLKSFLNNILVMVIEATGRVGSYPSLDGANCDDEESSPDTEEKLLVPESCTEIGVFAFDREDTPSDGESLQNLMDQLTGTSDDEEGDLSSDGNHLHGIRSPPIPMVSRPGWVGKVNSIPCDIGSKGSEATSLPVARTYDELAPIPCQTTGEEKQVEEVAADSILWLSRRLGPVLTAKHVTRNLLKMLTLCYTGPGALSPSASLPPDESEQKLLVSKHKVVGDENAERVLWCLKEVVHLYGEQFILVQYLPFMSDVISISKRKVTYSVEGGIVAALVLLKHTVALLSDTTLMDNLQDVILKDIVHPLVRLMVSNRSTFPSGYLGRLALTSKLIDTLYFIALHIGAEMTRVHLSVPSLQRVFLGFDKAVGLMLDIDDADKNVYDTENTFLLFVFPEGLSSGGYLSNLSSSIDDFGSRGSESFSGVAVVGNKIELHDNPTHLQQTKRNRDPLRHIRGNWLAYWEHEIGRSDKDKRFNFKQIKLQTFSGHSHGVRCLEVLDNENSLISGSRDKTVKLWSLRSQGDGTGVSQCQFTYSAHRKSLVGVGYMSGPRLVASCDSSVHLWDPFVGRTVAVVDGKSACSSLKVWGTLVLAGTADATLRIVDARTATNVAEHKISWTPAGLVRCICVSPDGSWAVMGQSSGLLTVFNLRTSLVMACWKGHEGEVLQVAGIDKNTFLSSSLDQTVSVWNVYDGKLKFHLKGPTEPVHCLRTLSRSNELISGTTANRIGVHTGLDGHSGFSSTKLRSDTFKGVLTCLAVLPLNMQLLLGADNGHITLLC